VGAIASYRIVGIMLLLGAALPASAQDFKGGTVTYQQTTRYDFAGVFGEFDNPAHNDWVATLPRKNESIKLLLFTPEQALFLQKPGTHELDNPRLQMALQKADYFQPPQPLLLQMHTTLISKKVIRQVEFMTRRFVVSGEMKTWPWRLTQKMIMVQGYTCMGAELKQDDDVITVYFCPEIPISIGPAEYNGLPGLIMAVEVNGETAFLATKVDLSPPVRGGLAVPDKGKKITVHDFKQIRKEKFKEWQMSRNTGKKVNSQISKKGK